MCDVSSRTNYTTTPQAMVSVQAKKSKEKPNETVTSVKYLRVGANVVDPGKVIS